MVSFEIQHFVANYEVDLCGHGTIAASKVVFDSVTNSPGFGQGSQFPAFCSPETHTLEFTTTEGVVISSRQVVFEDEEWFEIVLPAGKARDATHEEEGRILAAFARAMGKEPRIKYLGVGEPPFQHHLLVVFEESENIEHLKFVDAKALVSKASSRELHSPGLRSLMNFDTRMPLASNVTLSPRIPRAENFQKITSPECSPPLEERMKTKSAAPLIARWVHTGRPRKVSRS